MYLRNLFAPSEKSTWQFINHETRGGIECGAIVCGGVHRDAITLRLKGSVYMLCRSKKDCELIVKQLNGTEGWKGARVIAVVADRGCIQSHDERIRNRPAEACRPAAMLLNLHHDIVAIDDGLMCPIGSNCTWCDSDQHQRRQCPILLAVIERTGKPYRCDRCGAYNRHPVESCPFPPDYGAARDLEYQSAFQ